MFSETGTVQAVTRRRLLAASAVLLSATRFARAGDDAAEPEALPDGVTPVTKEDLKTRVPNFFTFDYQYGPEAGKRLWLRVDAKHWVERYESGTETRFRVIGRTVVLGSTGTLLVRLTRDPEKPDAETDDLMQIFVPDRSDPAPALLFRTLKPEPTDWGCLGRMQKVE